MKIAIVAAGGRLGGKLVTEALNRGHQVTAVVRNSPCKDDRAVSLKKDLFDLMPADIAGYDVLLSAYGSGFSVDPEVNRHAMNHLAELVRGTETRMISIAGAGCLYTDESRSMRVYETPSHPEFLKGISHNTALGVEDVSEQKDVHWCFVCPGVVFDPEGPKTGEYLVSDSGVVLRNLDENSYTSYDDLAGAMLDFADNNQWDRAQVTVVSSRGGAR